MGAAYVLLESSNTSLLVARTAETYIMSIPVREPGLKYSGPGYTLSYHDIVF